MYLVLPHAACKSFGAGGIPPASALISEFTELVRIMFAMKGGSGLKRRKSIAGMVAVLLLWHGIQAVTA